MINLETWEKETYETPESIKLIGMRYLLVRYSKGNLALHHSIYGETERWEMSTELDEDRYFMGTGSTPEEARSNLVRDMTDSVMSLQAVIREANEA
jgi:hypothetical protein